MRALLKRRGQEDDDGALNKHCRDEPDGSQLSIDQQATADQRDQVQRQESETISISSNPKRHLTAESQSIGPS